MREREVVHFQRFGEALRNVQDKLAQKKFYTSNKFCDNNPCKCMKSEVLGETENNCGCNNVAGANTNNNCGCNNVAGTNTNNNCGCNMMNNMNTMMNNNVLGSNCMNNNCGCNMN